jgi:hypothetical protein
MTGAFSTVHTTTLRTSDLPFNPPRPDGILFQFVDPMAALLKIILNEHISGVLTLFSSVSPARRTCLSMAWCVCWLFASGPDGCNLRFSYDGTLPVGELCASLMARKLFDSVAGAGQRAATEGGQHAAAFFSLYADSTQLGGLPYVF